MSHHIYHTTGLIVGLKPKGETDLLLKVFTRDFGMVVAVAQGARKMVSKNRFGLRLYAVPEFDLIKTRESFRVGAVRPEPYAPGRAETLVRAKVSAILARFVVSDEPHEKLFDDVLELIKKQNKDIDMLAMVVILENLGYWHSTQSDLEFIENGNLNTEKRREVINRINESISHIHL
jgi:recombinational DNA repair protein (RecF pathway)